MKPEDTKKALEVMRLILQARLVELTGIVWKVDYELSHWDYEFNCRYGLGVRDIRITQSYDLMTNPVKDMIENLMSDPLKMIASSFERRRRTLCPDCTSSLEKLEDKEHEWKCRHCAFMASLDEEKKE